MRNRDAHADNPEARADWVFIQRYAAKILGRIYYKPKTKAKGMRHPDDLELTCLEANELKVHILGKVVQAFEQLQAERQDPRTPKA